MNILKALHHEEKKLLLSQEKIEGQLHGIRAAINALNGRSSPNGRDPRKGRKLSAKHRAAIKRGIAAAKKEKK